MSLTVHASVQNAEQIYVYGLL